MKKAVLGALQIVLPLALGLWLVFYFYDQLDHDQREELFQAFRDAHWGWLCLCIVIGWLSHLSRAWRWRYLLRHLGYTVPITNAYHATMIGYFMNLLLPRAGEASRAMALQRTEGVPFAQGFGTILAERAVDLIGLAAIALTTVLLQLDDLQLYMDRIQAFGGGATQADDGAPWLPWLVGALVLTAVILGYLVWVRPSWRERVRSVGAGLWQGILSVWHTRDKGWFILHTAIIWGLYVLMFGVGSLALEATAQVPVAGIMAGFVAGTVGIVLVQGGIGVYPAFVALIVSIHMPAVDGGLVHPAALAIGWLLWVAQTAMLILLGGLSLILIRRRPAVAP